MNSGYWQIDITVAERSERCRWSQFVILAIGQLSGRHSLRDPIDNLSAQQQRFGNKHAYGVRKFELKLIAVAMEDCFNVKVSLSQISRTTNIVGPAIYARD